LTRFLEAVGVHFHAWNFITGLDYRGHGLASMVVFVVLIATCFSHCHVLVHLASDSFDIWLVVGGSRILVRFGCSKCSRWVSAIVNCLDFTRVHLLVRHLLPIVARGIVMTKPIQASHARLAPTRLNAYVLERGAGHLRRTIESGLELSSFMD